jgi:pimeloyl-ACP methyl ester carboxylesterase
MSEKKESSSPKGASKQVLQQYCDPESPYQLVMIHGIADSSDVWRETCEVLPYKFNSYYELDLPWSIEVGDPISYQPAPEQVLLDVWKQLPNGKKVVFAHSFGANSLVAMIQTEPLSDVIALVMLSVYSKSKYSDFNWPLFVRYVNEFDMFLASSIAVRNGACSMSERSKVIILEKAKQMYSPTSWIQFYKVFSQTPGLDLSLLTMPVLVLGGAMDFSIAQDDLEQFTKRLPNAELTIFENCGHFCMLEQPKSIADTIMEFLNKRNLLCQK